MMHASRRYLLPCQGLLVACLLFVCVPFSGSAVQPASVVPLLGITALPSAEQGRSIQVTGTGFTADGSVYIGLYDAWGATLHETRWVIASSPTYANNGSADGANGYVSGGSFIEAFSFACGSTVMVRAYDASTGVWTDMLDVETQYSLCAGPPRDDGRRTPD